MAEVVLQTSTAGKNYKEIPNGCTVTTKINTFISGFKLWWVWEYIWKWLILSVVRLPAESCSRFFISHTGCLPAFSFAHTHPLAPASIPLSCSLPSFLILVPHCAASFPMSSWALYLVEKIDSNFGDLFSKIFSFIFKVFRLFIKF